MHMLNDDQKAKLTTLRDFLNENRDSVNLDMGTFCAIVEEGGTDYIDELGLDQFAAEGLLERGTKCGASMCMLGWAGTIFQNHITTDAKGHIVDTWQDVGIKLFGTHNTKDAVGQFLFSSDWSAEKETNTIDHAIYRINRVLQASTRSDYENIADEWEDFTRGEGLYE